MTDSPRVELADVQPVGELGAPPRARIAMLLSLNFPGHTEETVELVTRFTAVAWQTVHDLGAEVVLYDTSQRLDDPASVAEFDGLLMLGGGDIDGTLYGSQVPTVPHAYGVDKQADLDGIAAFHAAQAADLPVLAICRGAQLVNVARGGTIIEDIDDHTLHHGGDGEPMFLDEQINLVPGSALAQILQSDRITGRSGHHQAVRRLGDDLQLAAVADDGIVEGFEDVQGSTWVVGVQWHPEDDDGPHLDRTRLFDAFVAQAARQRSDRDTGSTGTASA